MARFRFPGRSSDEASSNGDGSNGGGKVAKLAPKPDDAPKKRRRPKLRKLRIALVFFGLAILAFISWIFGIMMAVASDLPQLEDRAQFQNAQNSVVYDINGNKIATLTNNQGRILVPSVDIAPVMKEATVAIEDQRFYEHRGVDFQGIGRAVVQDVLQTGAAQGASTITEQFVKNALRAQDSRTIFEKLREAALAYQLERHWDKDKILTEYLNEIYFGNGAYGIEEAAKTYFGYNHPGCGGRPDRCAGDLLPWEAALLAGMISSPSGYDPVTNPQAAMARRNQVLQNMVSQGDITQEEYDQYSKEPLPKPSQIQTPTEDSKAPYFTSWLRQQLVDKYGSGEAFGGGLRVYSTLDLPLQQEVSKIAYDHTAGVGLNSAVVVLDNQTGGVRAMVGGTDYSKSPFNLATQGQRQPGSAFKPFTLVTALEQGHSPDQVFQIRAAEDSLQGEGAEEGRRHQDRSRALRREQLRGRVPGERIDRDRDHLLGQLRLLAARHFAERRASRASPTRPTRWASRRTSPPPQGAKYSVNGSPFEPYNPALILGGLQNGVTPLEMAHAYETLAQDGQLVSGTMADSSGSPIGIQRVDDSSGNPVETNQGDPGQDRVETKQVISPTVAATARSLLHSVVTSGTGTNANTGDPYLFGKTGTTENNGDAWFVGANRDVTIAVWVGHADSVKSMDTEYGGQPVDGGTIPAIIFHDVLDAYESMKKSAGAARPLGPARQQHEHDLGAHEHDRRADHDAPLRRPRHPPRRRPPRATRPTRAAAPSSGQSTPPSSSSSGTASGGATAPPSSGGTG